MAKAAVVDEQLDLIDVDHPQAKPLKRAIRAYNKLHEEKLAAGASMDEQRTKILDIVKGMGVEPDADGVICFKMNGTSIRIAQGKSQLRIKEESDEPEEVDNDDD